MLVQVYSNVDPERFERLISEGNILIQTTVTAERDLLEPAADPAPDCAS